MIAALFRGEGFRTSSGTQPPTGASGLDEVLLHAPQMNLVLHHGLLRRHPWLVLVHLVSAPRLFVWPVTSKGEARTRIGSHKRKESERRVNGAPRTRRVTAALMTAAITLAALIFGPLPASQAVVGGTPTDITSHPWQVLVIATPDNRLCGGSIVDTQWVITAAHCVAGLRAVDLDVHAGISALSDRAPGNQVPVVQVLVHPDWDEANYRNDVALLQLRDPLPIGSSMAPIALPSGQDAALWPPAGTPATISGWGSTEFDGAPSNQLRSAQVQILGGPDTNECGRYGGSFSVDVEICAGLPQGGVDACQGDSGSPLVIEVAGRPVLAGVTSVGFECARADYPGIFTRLTSFVSWLQSYVPALSGPPNAPQQVAVSAIAGERIVVEWQAPIVEPAPSGYRAVTAPGGFSCEVEGGARACVIDGATAGTLYEVTVAAIDAGGNEVSADPVPVVSVDGVTSEGARVKPKRIATWAGLEVAKKDKIWLAVRPGSADVCTLLGTKKKPRSVRADNVGLCAVRAIVVKPNGKRSRAIAYVEIV